MSKRKRIFLVLFTIFSCVGCDQITKVLAKSHLPRTKILSFAGDTLRLDYAENKGAVLTFESSLPEKWRGPVFSVAVSVFIGLIVLYLLLASSVRPLSVLGLSLVSGGILSNLIDRIVLSGNVVDFLNFGWGSIRSCIFNVADVGISVGVTLFVLSLAWGLRPAASDDGNGPE